MIRKQIYIKPAQQRGLGAMARKTGQAEAEIVRQALQMFFDEARRAERARAAWARQEAYLAERAKLAPETSGRTWTREELYDRPAKWHSPG